MRAEGANAIPTLGFLRSVGFVPAEEGGLADAVFPHPQIAIEAMQTINAHFVEVVMLSGVFNDGRTIALLEGQLPVEIDGWGRGLSLLWYFTRHLPLVPEPDWFIAGAALKDRLPPALKART